MSSSRPPRERVPTLSDVEDLAAMKADLVGAKLSGKIDAQGTLLSWLDGRLGQVEEGVRTLKGSVVFWGALPTALVAVAAIWAYLHGVKP